MLLARNKLPACLLAFLAFFFLVSAERAECTTVVEIEDITIVTLEPERRPHIYFYSAEYLGLWSSDSMNLLVSSAREPGFGRPSHVIRLSITGFDRITSMKLHNTSGPIGNWDTINGSGNHLILVMKAGSGEILNRLDGSVDIALAGESIIDLIIADNTAIASPYAETELLIETASGKKHSMQVVRQPSATDMTPRFISMHYRGLGSYDFVSDNTKPRSNLRPDNFLEARVSGRGQLVAVKMTASWDTLSGNGARRSKHWDTLADNNNSAIVLTRSDGKPLNKADGTVNMPLNGYDTLLLWFDNDEKLGDNPQFITTFLYSDGRIIEFTALDNIRPHRMQ